MQVSIGRVTYGSPVLEKVKTLGDRYKKFLGLLPYAAYDAAAQQGHLLAATLSSSDVVGYLLYSVAKRRESARITHLCVDRAYRKQGVGRLLVERVIEETKHLATIDLFVREDYESATFWPHLNFEFYTEREGRGKDRVSLFGYRYVHSRPNILTLVSRAERESKPVQASIDANIFFDLHDRGDHPLLADWLIDKVALCVTPELSNEIARHPDKHHRASRLRYLQSFPVVRGAGPKLESARTLARPYFPEELSAQDNSDLMHIAHSIAAEVDFFVTRDGKLRNRIESVLEKDTGLAVVSNEDLILHVDELEEKVKYRPRRFSGTSLKITHVTSGQGMELAEIFHRETGVRKATFENQLRGYLLDPASYASYVVTYDADPVALLVIEDKSQEEMSIPLLVIRGNPFSKTIQSSLVAWIIRRSAKLKKRVIVIPDKGLSAATREALEKKSFTRLSSSWLKVNLYGIYTVGELVEALQFAKEAHPSIHELMTNKVRGHGQMCCERAWLEELEKSLWPAKLIDSGLENFIVPIRPTWAKELFDYRLRQPALFDSDPNLMLSTENIYYRSARPPLPTPHSRILWYVTDWKRQELVEAKAIRASSYAEEVVVEKPSALYRQYADLGVYRWQQVLETAKGDLDQEVLAFRFTRTELFEHPVPLSAIRTILGKSVAPQGPIRITEQQFARIYGLGAGLGV